LIGTVAVPYLEDGVWKRRSEVCLNLRRASELLFVGEIQQQQAQKLVHIPISQRRQAPLLTIRETALPVQRELVLE
jgi:hypothetical protein